MRYFYTMRSLYLNECGPDWRIHVPQRFKVHKPFSFFVSRQSPCSSSPCQHKAICVTNYEDGSFGCRCAKGFIGEYCEKGE